MAGVTLAGLRIAVYARFSSEKQSASSIGDQVARAQRWTAERAGVVDPSLIFTDAAVSGASMQRAGMRALVDAIRERRLDVLVLEDLSRLSRDTADTHVFMADARDAGVRVLAIEGGLDTAGDEFVSSMQTALGSLMNEQYRRALRDKTLRGMEARARAGFAPSGVPLGYRTVREPGGSRIEIDQAGAELVRRIFRAYAAGSSYAAIAQELTRDGIPPRRMAPHRRQRAGWAITAIRAILHNERYSGRWTWGVRSWKRDRRSGTRVIVSMSTPRTTADRPDLVIVDADLFARVRERITKAREVYRGHGSSGRPTNRRARHWLAGLLVCGKCDAVLELWGPSTLRCSAARRGVCSATWTARRPVASALLLAELGRRLSPAGLRYLHRRAGELLVELAATSGVDVAAHQAAAARAAGRAEKLAAAIADGLDSPTVRAQLVAADREARAATGAAAAARSAQAIDLPDVDELLAGWRDWPIRVEESPDLAREAMRAALDGGKLRLVRAVDGSMRLQGALRPFDLLTLPLPVPESTGSGGCGGPISRLPVPVSALIPVDLVLSEKAA